MYNRSYARGNMTNTRKEKRAFRKMGMDDPVYHAYCEGQSASFNDHNPYPKGRRHDAWQQGHDCLVDSRDQVWDYDYRPFSVQ